MQKKSDQELKVQLGQYKNITVPKEDVEDPSRPELSKIKLKEIVLQKVIENCEIKISDAIINKRIDSIINNFKFNIRQQGMSFEDYLAQTNKDESTMKEELRLFAEEMLKKEAVLYQIAEVEKLSVTPDDIEEKLAYIASISNDTPDNVRKQLADQGRLFPLFQDILFDKVTRFLVDNCKYAN